jgi:hypothetical protein
MPRPQFVRSGWVACNFNWRTKCEFLGDASYPFTSFLSMSTFIVTLFSFIEYTVHSVGKYFAKVRKIGETHAHDENNFNRTLY